MNFKGISKMVAGAFTKKAPEILLGCSFASFFAAIIFAVRATPKAKELCEEAEAETIPEKIKAGGKCYLASAALFAGGIFFGCVSYKVVKGRYAALAVLYQSAVTEAANYRQHVIDAIGEKKEKEIQDSIAEEQVKRIEESKPIIFGVEYDKFYPVIEGITKTIIPSSIARVEHTINWLNAKLISEHYVSTKEFLYEFGVNTTELYSDEDIDYTGWNIDDGLVSFKEHYMNLKDGRPCVMITYSRKPRFNYDKFG